MRHAELKVISGKQTGSLIPLPAGKFLIGREEDCHLRPNSDTVSRHHCVFTVDDFTVRLRDLGSTNGTMVNGERIRGGVMLNTGDIVSIGKIEFEVQIHDLSLETVAEMQLETDTRVGQPLSPEASPPETAPPAVGTSTVHVSSGDSSYQIPAAETMVDLSTADAVSHVEQPPTGDTQFTAPLQQMPMQPTLGYPPMGYPQMMPPYGYPGYPGMYPQQMGYPMPGYGAPMPMQMPMGGQPMPAPVAEPEPEPEASAQQSRFPDALAIKLPDPSETGVKPPAPKPAAPAGGDQKTAEAKAKEEAPKMADDIIQQYLKRRPTTGDKK